MQESLCLQCKKVSAGPTNRLVQDSCGHKKCRVCLLEDEEKCRQCEAASTDTNGEVSVRENKNENGDAEIKEFVINNHTAVIKLNGNVSNISKVSNKEEKVNKEESVAPAQEKSSVEPSSTNEQNTIIEKKKTQARAKKGGKEKRAYNTIDIPKHITITSDPLSYNCGICKKSFVTKAHVKYHMYCASAIKPYKCEVCQKEFILRAQLDVHSYKHKNVKLHTCTVCQKSFADRSKLSRHAALHSNVKSHICSDCGNAYRSKESLRLHSIIHKGEKPYACKLCPSRFNNVSNLNKHVVSHSKEKAHMCDQCGRRFKLKWALSVHRKSHLRIRPFECSICLKTFVNKKELQRHGLIHADTKGYTCSICNMSLRRKDNLNRHMKNTHPGKKGEVIKNVVKPPDLPPKKPVDNPNAINVITASPAFTKSKAEAVPPVKSDSRTGTVINGPIKLAFKTPAFKSNYNINRDFNYVPPPQIQKAYDMAESVDICQKILSPHATALPRTIIHKAATSEEIFQKILSPYPAPPIHYETSFQNRKHALIKNIKFKVPIQYTNHFKEEGTQKRAATPSEAVGDGIVQDSSNNNTYAELKPVAMTSVIVNTNASQPSSMHWRRRTSQNLNLKN
ncbi:zinc finger protein 2 [Anoplophora glabripennis]|nr:zinc finger protein 2 [Anoplophora glabripennis]